MPIRQRQPQPRQGDCLPWQRDPAIPMRLSRHMETEHNLRRAKQVNAYLCKYITDYVVLYTCQTADMEEEAERFGLQTLERELGLTLERYEFECELEGSYQ